MTTRLRSRVSAVEDKVAGRDPKNASRLYFVKGYPTDGAEDYGQTGGICLFRTRSWNSSRGRMERKLSAPLPI